VAAYEKAVSSAKDALSVNSRDAIAHAIAAASLAKLGRLSEASTQSNMALKIDPTNQTVRYSAGLVAFLRGTSDVALTWLEQAVNAGYPVNDLQRDPEFASLRGDPAFRRAVQPRREKGAS
jgi:Flp pilus assembly protein TadD